jgi:hypothetical protein
MNSFQRLQEQTKSVYQFYLATVQEFQSMSHTKRWIWIAFLLFFIYFLLDFFFIGYLPVLPYSDTDIIRFTDYSYNTSQKCPNVGNIYNESTDKIAYSNELFGDAAIQQFSYSMFVYINSSNYTSSFPNVKKTIFIRSEFVPYSSISTPPIYPVNNSTPWIYMDENTNHMHILFQQGRQGISSYVESDFIITDFPLDIWTHIGIVIQGKNVSIYKNGKLIITKTLMNFQTITQSVFPIYFHPKFNNSTSPSTYPINGFEGGIAHFVFHRSAYTPKEMLELYTYQSKSVALWEKQKLLSIYKKLDSKPKYI